MKNATGHLARNLLIATALLPTAAKAAAPVYFDLGLLIFVVAAYLFGLIAIIIFAFLKKWRARHILFAIFAYIATPVLFLQNEAVKFEAQKNKMQEVSRRHKDDNLKAFSNYCKDRGARVVGKVDQTADEYISIRIDPHFAGAYHKFNAGALRDFIRDKSALCNNIPLIFIEGIYDARYIKNIGYETEFRRYAVCTRDAGIVVPELKSRYEMVLGEHTQRDPVPWPDYGFNWMSKSSVRLVDKSTGQTLAQDTLYFLRYEDGETDCPVGLEQMTQLIAETFH